MSKLINFATENLKTSVPSRTSLLLECFKLVLDVFAMPILAEPF